MITGDGGIIGKANDAKLETEKSDIEEQINTIVIRNSGDYTMDKDKLIGDFEEELPDGKEIEDSGDLIYIIYPDYSFEVDLETGKVTPIEGEKVEDETPWELAGSGTEADPYLIESIEDLVAFSNSVNEGNHYEDKYVKLTRTLDFNSSLSYDNPNTKVEKEDDESIIINEQSEKEIIEVLKEEGFPPIGNENSQLDGIGFRGVFDGNGKEIKNVYINSKKRAVGLFAKIEENSSCIKNLGVKISIEESNVEEVDYIGGIVGEIERGNIENCFGNVNIKVSNSKARDSLFVAAIAGDMVGNGSIKNCYSKGIISIDGEIDSLYEGGIVGFTQSAEIENCYNSIENNLENVTGNVKIGGIVGENQSTPADIINCYNCSNIKNDEDDAELGGIIGVLHQKNTTIQKCYNIGNIYSSNKNANIGGIIGYCWHDYVFDINNYKECYYKKNSATYGVGNGEEMNLSDKAGNIEAKDEMPSVINVLMTDNEQVEWNGQMVDVWKEDTNNINNGYPILYWQ